MSEILSVLKTYPGTGDAPMLLVRCLCGREYVTNPKAMERQEAASVARRAGPKLVALELYPLRPMRSGIGSR